MHYLRVRRLVLLLAIIMVAAALAFAWLRTANDSESSPNRQSSMPRRNRNSFSYVLLRPLTNDVLPPKWFTT